MSPARGGGRDRRSRGRDGTDGGTRGPRSARGREGGDDQVEGFHAVRELLVAGRRRVREVWLVDAAAGASEIGGLAHDTGVAVRVVRADQLRARARTEAPQGVLALAAPLPDVPVGDLLGGPRPFLVALDGVTDPGNLGAVLRTAETMGATGAVLTRQRSARLGPAATKAAAGAVEHVPIATVAGIPSFLDDARRADLWSVGLDGAGPVGIDDVDVDAERVVVVLGAEGRGLGRLTRERCDVVASIPMAGHLASLNVSAAAAIALHAVARLRRGSEPPSARR